jgi:ferritin
MALTAETLKHLEAAGLAKFFADHRQLYLDKARKAYQYASDYVQESGERVRIDDVAAPLVLALKVGDPLSDFLAGRKLMQQYWYDRFADYVLDQLWDEVRR